MDSEAVVISGMGVVSAAGGSVAESLAGLALGVRPPARATLFETPLAYPVYEVRRLPERFMFEGGRTLGLALCALEEAASDASLPADLSGMRVGVCMGTTVACQMNDLNFYRAFRETGDAPMDAVDRYLGGSIAEHIARRLGAHGPALTVANACSSGADAVGVAVSWLRGGLCEVAIAGGADELDRVPLSGFASLGIASREPCAPFDLHRGGLNLGEGAGVLVLETASSAARRGLRPRVAVLGYGSSADAHHLTAPRPDGSGLRAALERALNEAGAVPTDIAFVNAHGTATADNDRVEGRTLLHVLGGDVRALSTKGYTGHTLGAAGAIEAVFTALGLREGWAPRTAGFKTPDPEIGLVPLTERTAVSGRLALSTSLAFGGGNAALLLGLIS